MSMNAVVVDMPAGWSTVEKRDFLISETAFSLICAIILLFGSLGYGRHQYNMVNEKFQAATSGIVKKISAGKFAWGFSLTFLIAVTSIVLTSITATYYNNIDWVALGVPMPEQEPSDPENPVDVSLPK